MVSSVGVLLEARGLLSAFLFFFNDTATTEIYTLSLHDALPISFQSSLPVFKSRQFKVPHGGLNRSEEHTSELQSLTNLVCRLLLEKKKAQHTPQHIPPHILRMSLSTLDRREQLEWLASHTTMTP